MSLDTHVRRTRPATSPPMVGRHGRTPLPALALPLAALMLMLSSDYKFRIRELGESLSATPDLNTLAEIGIYGLTFFVLGRALLLVGSKVSAATPLIFLTWLYAAYMCASVVWSVYPVLALVRGWQFLVAAVLAAALARFATRRDLHLLVHWYVVVVAGSVVFGMLVHFPRRRLMMDRFNWLYVHPVIAGTWLGLAVVLTLWLLLTRKERPGLPQLPAWAYLVVLAFATGGLIGTQTRGAIGGCTVGVAALLLVRFRKQAVEVAALGLVAVTAVALLFLPTIVTFLSRGETSKELTSFNGRTPLWDQAYHLVLGRPLVGYGTTASRGLFFDDTGLGGAHNAAINVLVDGGLIGFALWGAVMLGIVRLCRPLLRTAVGRVDVPVIAAVLTFLFVNGGTTEGLGFVANVSAMWLFVLVGWVGVLCRRTPVLPSPRPPRPALVPRQPFLQGKRN